MANALGKLLNEKKANGEGESAPKVTPKPLPTKEKKKNKDSGANIEDQFRALVTEGTNKPIQRMIHCRPYIEELFDYVHELVDTQLQAILEKDELNEKEKLPVSLAGQILFDLTFKTWKSGKISDEDILRSFVELKNKSKTK